MKRQLEFGKDSMETQCLPLGPAYLTTRYREVRIVQTPTLIMMAFRHGMHREIFMDGRALEPDPESDVDGLFSGRWDRDVLVVESNGYTDRSWLDFGGHPHTEALRITERYTRRDIGRIDVHVTMVDPKAYTKPITFSMPMALQARDGMLEAFCENNHKTRERMALTLAGYDVVDCQRPRCLATWARPSTDDDSTRRVVHVVGGKVRNCGSTRTAREKKTLLALSPSRFSWSSRMVEFSQASGGGT